MHAYGGVQRRGRRPGFVAHAGHVFAHGAGGLQRQRLAVAGDHVAAVVVAAHVHLEPLERRIDVAHGAAGGAFLAHDVPGFERVAQRELYAARAHLPDEREAELEVRREPRHVERVAELGELAEHVLEVHAHEGRQHEAVVQLGAPARERAAVGLLPKARDQGAQQQLLRNAHARVRRHLEGAQLQEPQAPRGGVGRIQLVDAKLAAVRVARDVDEDVAQRAIDQPRRHLLPVQGAAARDFAQRDFELVELVVARLVHTRGLARGAYEQAAEQVRQRGVVVPVRHQAAQQLGAAQKGRVGGRCAAEHEVVAPAGAGVAPVGHELFGAQARLVRRGVEEFGVLDELGPVVRGVDVDLDHAGVGRDLQHLQAWVARRRVAFEDDLHAQRLRRGFDGGEQVQVVLEPRNRRHEHVQVLAFAALRALGQRAVGALRVARLHAQRSAREPRGRLAQLRHACV